MVGVNAYKDKVVTKLYKGLTGLVKSRGITVVEGEGRLVARRGPGRRGGVHRRRTSLLATGSVPQSLPGLEIDGDRVITSDHALRLDDRAQLGRRPRRRRDRRRVRQRLELLRRRGHHRRGAAAPAAARGGVELQAARARVPQARHHLRARPAVRRASRPPTPASTVTLEGGKTLEAELLLVAVGRGPVSAGLGYDEAGVADRARLRPRRRATARPTCPPSPRSAT